MVQCRLVLYAGNGGVIDGSSAELACCVFTISDWPLTPQRPLLRDRHG